METNRPHGKQTTQMTNFPILFAPK